MFVVANVETNIDLLARRPGHVLQGRVQHGLFAHVQHEEKRRAHHQCADRQQQKNSRNFPKQIFKARHRFSENGVNRAVLDVLGNESRRGDDRQQRRKDGHRAERNVFQNLEFLLKSELRHEHGAADQKQCENEQDIKNFQAGQLGQRVDGDRANSEERKSAMSRHGGDFVAHDSGRLVVASRNNRSSVVVDFRRSINFAFDRLMNDSISLTS